MGGIKVIVLRRDFELAKKKVKSHESHVHYGGGSYLNINEAILKSENSPDPILVFQEGNAVPRGVRGVGNDLAVVEPIGLEEFNPDNMISAEEADLMIHESVTFRAITHIVEKIGKARGFGLLFIIIIVVVIAAVVLFLKSRGAF